MRPPNSKFHDGGRDETLLTEGKYREWFWKGLSDSALSFLNAEVGSGPYPDYLVCSTCETRKPRASFNIGVTCTPGKPSKNRCNKCQLADTAYAKSGRWEDVSPVGWQSKASCEGVDREVFFPEGRNEYLDPDAEWRQYCPDCPVQQLCEDYAYQSKSSGIFGGKLFLWKSCTRTVIDEHAPKHGRPKKAA